jgi:putative FmdB family regulatory protein
MPIYTYRREDGTTFDIRQSFSDDPLQVDPQTGQKVVRVVQAANIVFKGSGFYVTDNKSARNATNTRAGSENGGDNGKANGASSESSTPSSAEASSASSNSSSNSSSSAPAGES